MARRQLGVWMTRERSRRRLLFCLSNGRWAPSRPPVVVLPPAWVGGHPVGVIPPAGAAAVPLLVSQSEGRLSRQSEPAARSSRTVPGVTPLYAGVNLAVVSSVAMGPEGPPQRPNEIVARASPTLPGVTPICGGDNAIDARPSGVTVPIGVTPHPRFYPPTLPRMNHVPSPTICSSPTDIRIRSPSRESTKSGGSVATTIVAGEQSPPTLQCRPTSPSEYIPVPTEQPD